MLRIQSRAVVDQPRAAVPGQQVRVARGPVQVHHERVEPDDVRTEDGIELGGARAEADCAGQEVDAEVETGARHQQILNFGIGFGNTDLRVELDQHELRHRQPERARELAGNDLRDKCAGPLAGTTELDHVQAVVVGLHETWQRPALTERCHIASS